MDDMDPSRRSARSDHPAEAGHVDVEPLADPVEEPELAAFLTGAERSLTAGPDELTARRHLAAMRHQPATRHRTSGLGLRVAGVAAAAAVAVVATLGGFGALPAPAQQVLADVAERVGLQLPRPAQDAVPEFAPPADGLPVPEHVPGPPDGLDERGVPGTPWGEEGILEPGRGHEAPPVELPEDAVDGRERAPETPPPAPEPDAEDPPTEPPVDPPVEAPIDPPGRDAADEVEDAPGPGRAGGRSVGGRAAPTP